LVTSAKWVGAPESGVIKVDLIDEGYDVLSCTFLAQVQAIEVS